MEHRRRLPKENTITSNRCLETGNSEDSTQKQNTSSSGGSASNPPQEECLIDNYEGPEPECPWETGEECFEWWVNHEEE